MTMHGCVGGSGPGWLLRHNVNHTIMTTTPWVWQGSIPG